MPERALAAVKMFDFVLKMLDFLLKTFDSAF